MYETPDVPEDTTTNNFDDYEVEGIERLHISTDDSSNKFKGKYLTGHIDYSHDDVRGGCWELAAHGEKETPIEKYRRIKCEMDELLNGIVDSNANATVSKKYKDNYEAISGTVNSAQKVLGSLRLENVLGTETNSSTSDHEIRKLIEQVEGFQKKSNTVTPSVRVSDQMPNTKRISELEARLHRLETIIGTTQPDKPNRLVSALDTSFTLLDSVQQVSTKAALLQPAQLDQLEERVSALSNKLDTINEKASILSGKKCASDEKITALYEIAKRTEPIAKILPDILLRMKALEMLHNHGELC